MNFLLFLSGFAKPIFVDALDGNDESLGTEDAPHQTIHQALTSAENGDTLFVGSGTYTGGYTILANDLTITTWERPDREGSIEINASDFAFVVEGERVRLENIEITGGSENSYALSFLEAADGNVEDLYIHDFLGGGVFISDAPSRIHFDKVHLEGIQEYPIYLTGNSYAFFENTVVRGQNTDIDILVFANNHSSVQFHHSYIGDAPKYCMKARKNAYISLSNSIVTTCMTTFAHNTVDFPGQLRSFIIEENAAIHAEHSIVNLFSFNPFPPLQPGFTWSETSFNRFPNFQDWKTQERYFVLTVDDRSSFSNAYRISKILDEYGLNMTFF